MTPLPSDERLNAFVDGETGTRESGEILEASRTDAGLRRRIAELQIVRALVRHAYARALGGLPDPTTSARPPSDR